MIALAAVLRFAFIGHQGYWWDESHTAFVVRGSWSDLFAQLPQTENTPPAYFVLAWFWRHAFGISEAGLRSLSALTGLLIVPLAWRLGTVVRSPRTGAVAAVLAATSPFLVWYSQEARAYMLLALLSGAALLALLEYENRPAPRPMALWGCLSALALATHYFAVLLIVPETVWIAVRHRRDRAARLAIAVVAVTGIALVPLLHDQVSGLGGTRSWISLLPLGPRVLQVPAAFVTGFGAPARPALIALSGAVVGLALATLARTGNGRGIAALVSAGAVTMALLAAAGYDEVIARNLIVLWLPLAVLVAAGLDALPSPLTAITTATLACSGVLAIVGVDLDRAYQRPDWRPIARALAADGLAGERAVLIVGGCQALPLVLYDPNLTLAAGTLRVRQIDVVTVGPPRTWHSVCVAARPAIPRLPMFRRAAPARPIGQFQLTVLRAAAPARVPWSFDAPTRYDVAGVHGILLTETR